jgi:hypothetical protein
MILNGILFLFSVCFFVVGCLCSLFGAFPMAIFCFFVFGLCYYAIRYDGPKPKQIHITYFNGDNGDDGGEDELENIPFNRNNFNYN